MTTTLEAPRQVIVKNVKVQFPKLGKAVTFRGSQQWELSMITEDAAQAKEWKELLLPLVKPNDSVAPTAWTCSLNRKTTNKDGSAKEPVRVVDENKQALSPEAIRKIGNGSEANIIVFQGPYDNEFGTGNTNSLTAIQFTKIVEYTGGMSDIDFDVLGAPAEGAEQADMF